MLAAVCAVSVATMGLAFAGESEPSRFDQQARQTVLDLVPPGWDAAFFLDSMAQWRRFAAAVAFTVLLCAAARRYRLAMVALVGIPLSAAVTTGLKPVVDRHIHGDFLAFPSGHTAVAAAAGMVLGLLVAGVFQMGRIAGTVTVLAAVIAAGVVMAWSQMVLNTHYATDMVGGLCCAVVTVYAVAWLMDAMHSRHTAAGFGMS